jgi:putative radical SAM enzyme (TIGR03279 family)
VGIEPGDFLVAVNGQTVQDILDYMEWTSSDEVTIAIEKSDGQEWFLEIEKDPDEDLGLTFEQPLMDRQRTCCNKCIFCFIDQLPKGMRSTLYCKDDDWRLSFLMGNYITLTNLSRRDVKRIVDRHISPLYVSVHTTNLELRRRMMGNKRAGELLNILKEFEKANISIHCQIVLCRNWNDGHELERTLSDLWNMRCVVRSVAVVPAGLTRYREGLEYIMPYDAASAEQVLEQVEKWQVKCRAGGGTAFVFAADEFYILASKEFPRYEDYEDFPQIENGVGLVAKLTREFEEAIADYKGGVPAVKQISVATGVSAYPTIRTMMDKVKQAMGVKVYVYPVTNHFFGQHVTVAGLLTGRDILNQLKDKELGHALLIPCTMLRRGEDVFLDDVSVKQLSRWLQVAVVPVPVNGRELIEVISAIDKYR